MLKNRSECASFRLYRAQIFKTINYTFKQFERDRDENFS